MPINPNILLQGQVADIGKAVGQGLEAYQQTRRNVLLEEQQKREAETTNISNAINLQKMQVQGAALAAQRALPYLQSGDMAGLKTFVQGTNLLDDQDKAEFSAKIDANDLQGILGDVSGAIGMAQQMGIFAAPKEAADTRTAAMKEAEAIGLAEGTPEYRNFILSRSAKTPSVSIKQGVDPKTGQPGFYQFADGKLVGKVEGVNPPAQTGIVVGPDGTVTVGALSSGNVGKAQEKVTGAIDNLSRLKDIRSTFDPQFLTYVGKGRQALLKTKERAGVSLDPTEKQYLGQYRQFSEGVEQFFNQYKKDITGAAAAVAEISALKDSIINTDLSPTEFTSSYDRLVNEATRTINIQNSLLEKGLSPSSKDFQNQADQLFLSGRGKNFMQRGMELEKQGLNDEQIKQQLRLEGYSIR
jgi:hypothetical protein